MRKADRETESRKLIGEKLREARMADNSPMTEADAEYYRILAEARATHASKENTRKSAKKHAFTSAAAILLILAVAGGSFILGMQSDVRASADPDDERKVVQQGDNIVIGSGVSEDDENVGVVTKTYYSLEDVPENIKKDINLINDRDFEFERIKISNYKNAQIISAEYSYLGTKITINEKCFHQDNNFSTLTLNIINVWDIDGITVYEIEDQEGKSYSITKGSVIYDIVIHTKSSKIKIEDILDDLHI